jgi:hypothetical protein
MIGDWDIMQIGIGAGATLCATVLYSRAVAMLCPPRVPPAFGGVRPMALASPAVDQDQPPEPEVVESGTDHDSVVGASVAHSATAPVAPAPPARPVQRARMTVNAPEQIRDFLAWMTAEGYARPLEPLRPDQGRYTAAVWWTTYLGWCEEHGILPLAEPLFLGALGRHPRIQKSRDRVKDQSTGRVVKNAAGTPLRESHYTLHELALVDAYTEDAVTGRRRKLRVAAGEVTVRAAAAVSTVQPKQRRAA